MLFVCTAFFSSDSVIVFNDQELVLSPDFGYCLMNLHVSQPWAMARKKKQREYSADFAFHVAEGFYAVGLRVARDAHQAVDYFGFAGIMPAAIDMSLALELYLKALHIVHGHKPSGHHLWTLFKTLPQEIKKSIETQYQRGFAEFESIPIEERELSTIRIVLRRADSEPELDNEPTSVSNAKDFFLLHDNAFEVWRYLHEFPQPEGYVYEYHFGAMNIMTKSVREYAFNLVQDRGSRIGLQRAKRGR